MNEYKKILNENLLQPVIDYSLIKIADSNFLDDVWVSSNNTKFRINFVIFNDLPIFKEQVRIFLLEEYRKNSLNTVITKYTEVKFLYKFLREFYPSVKSLQDLNEIIVNTYFHYILSYKRTIRHSDGSTELRDLSTNRIIKKAHIIQELLELFLRKETPGISPDFVVYINQRKNDLILSNPKVAKNHNRKPTTKNEYSIETIKKILFCAYNDPDLYLKTLIMIESQVGLRISEILSIEEDAITGMPGNYLLGYLTSKTKKGEVYVEKPINDIAAETLLELIKFTEPIRKRLNTKKVFVISIGSVRTPRNLIRNIEDREKSSNYAVKDFFIKVSNINRNFITPFLKRWNITEDGNPIHLSTHYGRHFFAHLSWLEGMSVQSIRYMLNHESFAMTATYMYNAESSMKNKFKEMMSSPEYMIGKNVGDYQKKLSEDNVFKGKTEKQLDAIIGVMNIQILPNGACMHHPLKAEERLSKCSRKCDACEKFVTHACYLEVHELRVKRLEQIMEDALNANKLKWYERTKQERDYILKNYIEPFKNAETV